MKRVPRPLGAFRAPPFGSPALFASAARWVLPLVALAMLPACGGSASETPFPLPPHPLNEPYRTKRVAGAPAPVAAPETERGGEERRASPEASESEEPARETWGGPNTPAPAPVSPSRN
jgi:hypothetical protein